MRLKIYTTKVDFKIAPRGYFLCYTENMNLDFSSFDTPEMIIMAAAGLTLIFFGYRIKKIAFFIISRRRRP